jgi:AcrR family transcriptional regulator
MTTTDRQSTGRFRRPRNAAASRTAILTAARACFSGDSYERVGVRDIATCAGVTAALVIRYFGSKERLFAEALRWDLRDLGLAELLAGDLEQLGARLARYVVLEAPPGPFLTIVRVAPNAQAAALVREITEEEFTVPLARRLAGEHAALRASNVTAMLLGLAVRYHVLQDGPASVSEGEAVVALVAPALQCYLTG